MKYFIPDWDDRVDPCYDFDNDRFGIFRGGRPDDIYVHELFNGSRPFDGILVSRAILDSVRSRLRQAHVEGIHNFLRVESGFPVMGDCGAWSYVNEEKPLYTPGEVAADYEELGFDYGVSVDHLAVKSIKCPGEDGGVVRRELSPEEIERRCDLSLFNAAEFYLTWKRKGYSFHPIGAVQGWDVASYQRYARLVAGIGYDYIGIGGIARRNTRMVLRIAEAVRKTVPKHVRIHLFGIGRFAAMKPLIRMGITSTDSAVHLRNAWMSSTHNYLTLGGESYTAIRVPYWKTNRRIRARLAAGEVTREEVRELEERAINSLRLFAQDKLDVDGTLEAIMDYDRFFDENRRFESAYRRLLEDRPWESCPCDMCRAIGIEVIIFRRNDRNRRRGFHNTWVFHQTLKQLRHATAKS